MKVLRWLGMVLGGLIALVLIAAVVLYVIGSGRITKTYTL